MLRKDVYIMNNFVLEMLLISLVSSFTFIYKPLVIDMFSVPGILS